jgi:hypothetical protein
MCESGDDAYLTKCCREVRFSVNSDDDWDMHRCCLKSRVSSGRFMLSLSTVVVLFYLSKRNMNSIQSSKHLAFAGLSSHTCRYCQKIMFTSAEPLDEQTFLFSYNEVLEAKSDGCDLFSTQFNALQSILDQYRMDRHNEELWTLQTRISLDGNTFHFIAYDWLEHGESLLDSDDSKELHAFTLDGNFVSLLPGLNAKC